MVNGIDKIVYGVEDLSECVRFFRDWGLADVDADTSVDANVDAKVGARVDMTDARATFATLDGAEVELRPVFDASLPAAFEPGSTVRQVVWGVEDERRLEAVRERLASSGAVDCRDGDPGCTDPSGLHLSFRVSRRRKVAAAGSQTNTVDRINRIDRRATVYARAEPVTIGHIVLFVPALMEAVEFYTGVLGFVVSDYYPDFGYFLRCAPEGGHHNLFLMRTPDGRCGLNHVAFTVRDLHEVFGGGLHVGRCGWRTQIGPGRHPISSAYFWYVHNPAGGLAEYYADEDYCTADWKPEAWERSRERFAEWAIEGGIDGNTRRQTRIRGE